jgi:hypothetical protein
MRLRAQHEEGRAIHHKAVPPILLDDLGDGVLLHLRLQGDDNATGRQQGHQCGGAEKLSTTHASHIERFLSNEFKP